MKKTNSYAWVVCAICALVYLCSMGFSTSIFSVTVPYIRDYYGFTNTMTTSISTYRVITSLTTIFFLDKILKVLGNKKALMVGLAFEVIGYIFWGFAKSYTFFVIGTLCMGVTNALAGIATVTFLISNWFNGSRGMALSIVACGTGFGSMFMPKLVTSIAEKISVPAVFFAMGSIVLVALLLAAFFTAEQPEKMGLTPFQGKEIEKNASKSYGKGLDAFEKKIILLVMFFWGYSSGIVAVGLTSMFKEASLSTNTVTNLMTIYGVAMIVWKLLYGKIHDKKGNKTSILLSIAIYVLAFIFVATKSLTLPVFAVLTAICFGCGMAVTSVGMSCTPYDFFKEEGFVKNVKNISIASNIGNMISGILTGKIADVFGTYSSSALLGAIFYASTIFLLLILYKNQSKKTLSDY